MSVGVVLTFADSKNTSDESCNSKIDDPTLCEKGWREMCEKKGVDRCMRRGGGLKGA